jgi:predicted membrane-bound mannosyltransferase
MTEETTLSQTQTEKQQPDLIWLSSCGVVTAIAAFLRFFWLALKPLHHDEGVNGFFLTNLVRDGVYKYDPANYHGPTLYYIAYPFVQLFGLKTIPIRSSVAIFGVLTVVLCFYLRPYMGRIGSLFAGLFVALSPGMVYISRYFIHEIFFVFLALAFVLSVLMFVEKRTPGYGAIAWIVLLLAVCFVPSGMMLSSYIGGESTVAVWAFRAAFLIVDVAAIYFAVRMILAWNDGRPVYLMLASASVALMFATKETAFITLGTMAIACLSIWVWSGIRNSEAFEKNRLRTVLGMHVVVAVAAALFYRTLIEGSGWLLGNTSSSSVVFSDIYYRWLIDGPKWLHENFLGEYKVPEPFVYYTIIFLLAATVSAWMIFLIGLRRASDEGAADTPQITWKNFRSSLGENSDLILTIAAVGTIFVYVSVLFFSSYFTYGEGVKKAFEAYTIWTKTGSKDHTQNGGLAYIRWGMKVEAAVLILSALGALIALLKGRQRFAMFTAMWAFGLFLAYTIIPYKTPWLALSYLLPMCIVAGYGIGEMLGSRFLPLKAAGAILALAGTSLLGYQAYDLNFVRYDDEEMGYVYAHTKRGFNEMMDRVEYYAAKSGQGKDATIEIVSPDYWPMTWYLNDYKHANFHGQLVDANTSEMIISKKNDQDVEVIRRYSAHYKYAGVWPLRPGVDLVLLVRKDLADPGDQELYKIGEWVSPEIRH